MSKRYKKAPSDIIGIEDPYSAYCLNEACLVIQQRIENKEKPVFEEDKPKESYTTLSEMYDDILNK